jgi:primosomal protein N' (replication factor Y)
VHGAPLLECLMSDAPDVSSPHPTSSISTVSHPIAGLADVVLPRHLYRVFTYQVPTELRPRIRLGSRVLIPFGQTFLQGMVVGFRSPSDFASLKLNVRGTSSGAFRLREIKDLLDDDENETPSELLALTRLVSDYYLAPWGQCIRLILPPSPTLKKRRRYLLTPIGREALHKTEEASRLSSADRDVLSRLARRSKGLGIDTLRHTLGPLLNKEVARLKRRKLIMEVEETESLAPSDASMTERKEQAHSASLCLQTHHLDAWEPQSSDETAWVSRVRTAIAAETAARFLIKGARARRWACVFELVAASLQRRRNIILLTPDIARAEALAECARSRWGEQVGLIHSGLSAAHRNESRTHLGSGSIRILVGTRSAIFAPLSSIGLMYVDEEENPSFKEETEPRYHARDVAWMRAQLTQAVVLLGSSHPSLETMSALEFSLAGTLSGGGGASSSTLLLQEEPADLTQVDQRQTPYGTLLSHSMISGIRAALDARTGIILFLNRKGFSPALVCRECGLSPQCPHCSVGLTFRKQAGRLSCHYCSYTVTIPDTCPTCQAARLEPSGMGTEAVEEQTRRLFPRARIARLDRETAASGKQAASIRNKFMSRELDILIGTQMLCQGEPLLAAGFVGVVHADAGLHLPDFRASEHTFHTLMDALALARPKREGGRVVLQTLLPTHYVIQAVSQSDPTLFYSQEFVYRQALGYPPCTHLISLRISGTSPNRTQQAAEQWSARLQKAADVSVWGPIPSPVAKLRQKYRWDILVKSADGAAARRLVQHTLTDLETHVGQGGIKFEVDVDPISMY